jgi:hypothetical protein
MSGDAQEEDPPIADYGRGEALGDQYQGPLVGKSAARCDSRPARVAMTRRVHLARIIHEHSTADADSTASSRPSPSGHLDVLPSTPPAASGPRVANLLHYRRPRYELHE